MTALRDQVVCRQCGAVLGTFVARRTGRQAGSHPDPVARIDLNDRVGIYVTHGRAEVSCPDCGQVRLIDLMRHNVFAPRKAA